MGFIPFSFIDLIDILLVATLMYGIYRATKGTNAPYILAGIIFMYVAWVIVRALNMELLSGILGQIISVGVIALLIVFQPEIRQFLLMIGMRQKELSFINRIFSPRQNKELNLAPIVAACRDMSESKTGALIVIGQQNSLDLIIDGGIRLDAAISQSLLKNIFFKNAPLHDGAVIIEENRIVAAKCILPVTQSPVPKSYGTRHRSAIGMSEISDAIIVVVSEETGIISVAYRGQLKRNIDINRLAGYIGRIANNNTARQQAEKEKAQEKDKTPKEKKKPAAPKKEKAAENTAAPKSAASAAADGTSAPVSEPSAASAPESAATSEAAAPENSSEVKNS